MVAMAKTKVQAVLDLNNIPYTGSGALASGITMDKSVSGNYAV